MDYLVMTARFAASLSALLLLGVAPVPAMAELVPVEPNIPPAAYYGLPPPEAEVVIPGAPAQGAANPAAKPADAAAANPADKPDGPGELIESWDGGAAKKKDGSFAYCVVEGEFTSGHVLMIARSPKGETNIGIGIPGADLPKGGEWPVTVEVDKKLKRERVAIASQPDMLVVSNGRDEELVGALMSGNELVVSSASDRIAFKLSGTKKVLGDLKTCVDKSGNVPPIKVAAGRPAEKPAEKKDRLPEGLDSLLTAAGIHDAELVPMDKLPPERRPADVAWRFGPIVGGIRERAVGEGSKLDELSDSFADAMKQRCEGTATVALDPPEQAGSVWIRTGSVDCAMPQGKLHVTLNFLLSQRRLFTVLFHEAAEQDVQLADKVRENLAQVLRRAGTAAPALAPADGAASPTTPPSVPPSADAAPASPPPAAPAAPSNPAPAPAPAAPAAVKPQTKPQPAKP
ncbi:hypothetical protein VY88_22985 [Azospirillum thiophilum]|uniref:Uncharacterized protein n=2 Tax=Azospirillum thiophilum TaxID=528244 RepID=A0AAC8W1Z8_9PROT|nr:hypothetical protein AL072_22155 [Azospirillum thiophilum]KJR63057.1 hypothetical protein VY88_22985 [Azospirillum thiophilum]